MFRLTQNAATAKKSFLFIYNTIKNEFFISKKECSKEQLYSYFGVIYMHALHACLDSLKLLRKSN